MARDSEAIPSSSQDLLQDWLLDYVYHLALDEFTKEGTVDNVFNRDFIQGLLNCVTSREPKASEESYKTVNKLFTMCCVADGELCEEDDNDGSISSKLELLLSISSQLADIFGDTIFKTWSSSVKRQAVFVSWRNGNFDLSREIYGRVFAAKCTSSEESKVRDEVDEVLKTEDMFHGNLQKYPFEDLVKETAVILKHLETNKHHTSILEQLLQNNTSPPIEKSEKEQKSIACQTELPLGSLHNVYLTSEFTNLVKRTKLSHLEGKPYRLPSKWRHKFANKVKDIANNKDFYLQTMPSFDNLDDEESNSEELPVQKEVRQENSESDVFKSSPTPSPKGKSRGDRRPSVNGKTDEPKTKALKRRRDTDTTVISSTTPENIAHKKSRGSPDRLGAKGGSESSDDETLSEDDDKDENRAALRVKLPSKVHLRRSLAPTSPKRTSKYFVRGQRLPWTTKEEEKFYRAIQECGIGNWSEMLVFEGPHSFPQRTNVHLKDKWRTMQKNGRAEELHALYGPV